MHLVKKADKGDICIIPAYVAYAKSFSSCDAFNRGLHDRKLYHKTGVGSRMGDNGHHHKFAMAVVMQNIFNVTVNHSDMHDRNIDFVDYSMILADEIFKYSMKLN